MNFFLVELCGIGQIYVEYIQRLLDWIWVMRSWTGMWPGSEWMKLTH